MEYYAYVKQKKKGGGKLRTGMQRSLGFIVMRKQEREQ